MLEVHCMQLDTCLLSSRIDACYGRSATSITRYKRLWWRATALESPQDSPVALICTQHIGHLSTISVPAANRTRCTSLRQLLIAVFPKNAMSLMPFLGMQPVDVNQREPLPACGKLKMSTPSIGHGALEGFLAKAGAQPISSLV